MFEFVKEMKKVSDMLNEMTERYLRFELNDSEVEEMNRLANKKFGMYERFAELSRTATPEELNRSTVYGIAVGVL